MHASLDDYIVSPAEQRRRALAIKAKFAPPRPVRVPIAKVEVQPDHNHTVNPKRRRRGHWEWDWGDPLRPISVVYANKRDLENVRVRDVVDFTVWYFGLSKPVLFGQNRYAHLIRARHIAFWLAREVTGVSLLRIGGMFGDRDHTTVLHGIRKVEEAIAEQTWLGLDAMRAKDAFSEWWARR